MPFISKMSPQELVKNIYRAGPQRCILTTAFGQYLNPPPSEGMRMAIATLIEAGMPAENISTLIKDNPIRLAN